MKPSGFQLARQVFAFSRAARFVGHAPAYTQAYTGAYTGAANLWRHIGGPLVMLVS